jgi:nicotinamidase/pyrazinamidase
VAGTPGARFAESLRLPDTAIVVSKADSPDADSYSAFGGTDLAQQLERRGVKRVFVGGLATDYCVLNTVLDALAAGFEVVVLGDAVRAVEVSPGDAERAIAKMGQAGARLQAP